MKLKDGRISIVFYGDKVKIELRDGGASLRFCDINLSPEQFAMAMKVADTECDIEVYEGAFGRLGKAMEHKKFEFELPTNESCGTKIVLAQNIVLAKCPMGWIPDLYFGSSDSFFTRDGKPFARTTIRRWV